MRRTQVSFKTSLAEKPPVPDPTEARRRRTGFRLVHLMYAVLYVVLFCWLGAMTGLAMTSGLMGILFAIVIGVVVIFSRRRSTQQDALLWALAIATEREMPLAPTLDVFSGQCRGSYRRKVLAGAHHLRQGLSLAQVLDHEPGLFPRDAVVLIRIASESGGLAGSLREASTTRAATRGPWIAFASRLIYLLWIIMILQTIVMFISYFVIPKFQAIFSDFGMPLPAITVMTMEASRSLVTFWPLVMLFLLAQVGMLVFLSISMFGSLPWEIPLLDRIFLGRHSAVILRCLARVVEGDRPMAQGLEALSRIYPARRIRDRLEDVSIATNRGDDWCEALARHGLIRPSEAGLLEAARRAGNLPWALREAAGNNERRLAYRFQALAAWLLPLVLILIGALVFVLAVSYFLPLVSLIQKLA